MRNTDFKARKLKLSAPSVAIALITASAQANDFYKAYDMDDDYQLWLDSTEYLYDTEATDNDDIIISNNGVIFGGNGNDTLKGGTSANILNGGSGNDMLFGGDSRDTMGNCDETNSAGNDRYYGQAGNDFFCDDHGHNIFYGGPGDDEVYLLNELDNGTDNTYVWTEGNDKVALGRGFDTLVLKNIKASDARQWTVHLTQPFAFSLAMISNSAYLYNHEKEKSGYIEGPEGQHIEFSGVNKFDIQYTYPLQFDDISTDPYIIGTIISGLPEGFAIKGMAQPPQLHQDGYWFQAVDPAALAAGELELIPAKGWLGELNLNVIQVRDRALAVTELKRGTLNIEIHPTHDDLLFAKFGAIKAEFNGDSYSFGNLKYIPLNIIVNPKVNGTIVVNLAQGYDLRNNSGLLTSTFNSDGLDIYYLRSKAELEGLTILDRTDIEELEVYVSVTGGTSETGGDLVGATQALYKPDFSKGLTSGVLQDRELRIHGSITDYDISRIGNNFMVKHITRPREEFLVDMVNIPMLEFNDGFVSARDYWGAIGVGDVVGNVSEPSRTLITFSNLPVGSVINNAFQLGEGVFAMFAEDVRNGVAYIDYPSVGDRVEASVEIGTATLTDDQLNLFGNTTRVQGYVNADLFARAGANANLSVGADGVSAEARAFVEAGGVATAGGSVGGLNGEVSAEVVANADVAFSVMTSETQASIGGYAVAQASATAGGTIEFENEYIPGTETALEGTAGVNATAYIGGDSNFYFGDGRFGGSAQGGFEAGYSATADGYAYNSVAGIGGGVGGGVSAGPGVGFDAGGFAMYDNGVISFGLSGEALALVGVEFEFDANIDANAVADTGQLIGRGVVTAANAVAMGAIDGAEAVRRNYITAEELVGSGLMKSEDAVLEGLMSANQAINSYGANASVLAQYGYSASDTVSREAISDAIRLVQDNTYNRLANKTVKRAAKVFRKI